MGGTFPIRPLADGDWTQVARLEAAAYTPLGLSEGRAALEALGRRSPGTCYALEHDGRLGGYLLALPYPPLRCPDLGRPEPDGPAPDGPPDNLHAHDLVIAEELRGRGLAARLMGRLADTARERGFTRMSLVAVGGSDVLWSRLGYRALPEVALPASYGRRAVYMSTAL
ncbi:GNAT family N-acetyltransferase [Kitasatospora sp. NPDC004240]